MPRLGSRGPVLGLVAAVALGIVLRLIWPGDMEYKADERFLFAQVTGPNPFPWEGQTSSVGPRNPGMGIWVYSALFRGLGISTPVGLVRWVMVLNVVALLALVGFAVKVVAPREREPWLWATALLAVNPLAVLFSRKLWVQCILPPFVMATLLGWWRRGSRLGAFAWGLVGAWLGQIHMSGFFFAGGLALWTALFDRSSTRWRWWLTGSLLGAATLAPWLIYILGHAGSPTRSLANTVTPEFFPLFVSYPLSLNLFSSFGSDTGHLLAWPSVAGTSTHLVTVAAVVIVLAGLAIVVEAFARAVWPRQRQAARPLGGRDTDTGLSLRASVWGFGLLLTASGVLIYRHYLIVAYALPFVGVAVAALVAPDWGRRLLTALIIAEAGLSVGYLTYVHARGGAPGGEYGVSYDHQVFQRGAR